MTRLLLDTHTALWWAADDRRLSDGARTALADDENEILLSAVVVWEIAIKRGLGKLDAPSTLPARLLAGGARGLPVSLDHAAAVEELPEHHRDPFDRLLIAQAVVERGSIVSRDPLIAPYDVDVVW
ncbi:MAG: type II toxin-antitoxin system VapC family toxin [Solirubrobacterales bacterium]|nr:type II toxin-antitoxin system VapC family toxin [Solirubrobacterales bacterium]